MSHASAGPGLDGVRLTAVISPLRRSLLAAARRREGLPDIPDAQVEIVRALPRGTVSTPGALAETLGIGRSTVSNLLAAMERGGLIVRRPSASDGRSVEVLASPDALGIFDRFDAATAVILDEATAGFTDADLRALADALPVLERLRDALRPEPITATTTPASTESEQQ